MSDEEQGYGAWRAEQQRRAQAHAFIWAERANAEYSQAIRHEDDARARQNAAAESRAERDANAKQGASGAPVCRTSAS